ncbi:MAG: hypothetical protein ACYDBX_04635 [Patescibacteria group bacterium]
MDHVAILSKKLKLKDKILNKEKTIESRWYITCRTPFNRIKVGERIYFKDTGGDIDTLAKVYRVIQFENLDHKKVRKITKKYSKELGLEEKELYNMYKDKNYCILMFLKDPRRIKPFRISKKGFGSATAWIGPIDIDTIIER